MKKRRHSRPAPRVPRPSSRAPRRSRRPRRGVLLIIVLSLLVMFALIGFTFVLVAGHYDRAARASSRTSLTDDQGRDLIEQAILDLLRGPTNTASALYSDNDDSDFDAAGNPIIDEDRVDGTDNDGDGLIDEDPPGRVICSSLLEDFYGSDGVANGSVSSLLPNGPNDAFFGFIASGTFASYMNAYAGRTLVMASGPLAGKNVRIMYSLSNGPATFFYIESFRQVDSSVTTPSPGNKFFILPQPFNGVAGRDADESYDAPDRLNPFLAFLPTDATTATTIPSFADRLLDYNGDSVIDINDLVVDNDRDGNPDSGFIDFNLPIKTAADGRRYKPYPSILCIDLDGRLNLNAHGNLAQLTAVNANYTAAHPGPLASSGAASGPRGMGFGPADVNLAGVFSGDQTKYSALLDAKYGADLAPGPGTTVEDLWLLNGYGIPNDYANTPAGYASRPDVLGGGLLGVDAAGRPVLFNAGLLNEVNGSPYQIDLVTPNGHDQPFTATELERLLRWNDVDRDTLPKIWDRHNDLSEADFSNIALRRGVTTASSHVPVAAAPGSAIEMLVEQLKANGVVDASPTFALRTNSRMQMPFGIMKGGKMDVNRHWGNALDSGGSANNVIDEVGEISGADTIFGNVSAYGAAIAADYLNRTSTATNQNLGRYHYARHLFCLMMVVSDPAYKRPLATSNPESLTDPQRRELAVQRIAQWAINCVDFRDPDAIMTPFEYDFNPFNGWICDGDVGTDEGTDGVDNDGDSTIDEPDEQERRVVWGMEYPDLMFTEALNMHNRRVRDTTFDDFTDASNEDPEDDTATNKLGTKRIHSDYPTDNMKKGDKDLDQVRIPQGTTFLEFYCPRNTEANNPVLPRELYEQDAADGNKLKLKLDKKVGDSPVWRVAISRPHHNAGDGVDMVPNTTLTYNQLSPLQSAASRPDTVTFQPDAMSLISPDHILPIERYLWFTSAPPAAATSGETAANTFYVEDSDAALLEPGRYCLVGPRDETYLGGKPISDDALALPETEKGDQLIDLNNASVLGVDYTDLDGTSSYPLSPAVAANVHPPLALNAVIESPDNTADAAIPKRGLNISEPLPTAANKYPTPTHDPDGDGVKDAYGDSSEDPEMNPGARYEDTPFDSDDSSGERPLKSGDILVNQTVQNYRTAFLQRLANPLLPWNPAPPHANYNSSEPVNPYVTIDWIPLDLHVFNGEDREPDDWGTRMGINGDINTDFDTDDDGTGTLTFAARQRLTPSATTADNNIWTPGGQVGAGVAEDTAADECFRYKLGAPSNPMMTLGYVNLPYTPLGGSTKGDPDAPFPWLMWPNRPFVSHYELMLVPATSQSRLMSEFTRALTATSPYDPDNQAGMFGHLLNFYHQSPTAGDSGHFYRILEYLEVPSRFAGTRRWYDYSYTNTSPFHTSLGLAYKSPYHNLSRFRDPGRLNINTIPGAAVWEAIDNNANSGTAFTSYAKIDASRRYVPGVALPQDAWGRFSNPFRGAVTAANTTSVTNSLIEGSLLRKDLDITPLPTSPATALDLPLLGPPAASAAYKDPAHNAYFRMQGLQRMGNILTTQSNVYAVWITVAFFEVDGSGAPLRELGTDTGEIRRHRGFFMIDRSIPVLFQRGSNHNVDKVILVRRYIE